MFGRDSSGAWLCEVACGRLLVRATAMHGTAGRAVAVLKRQGHGLNEYLEVVLWNGKIIAGLLPLYEEPKDVLAMPT
jgi:hypothetical protein